MSSDSSQPADATTPRANAAPKTLGEFRRRQTLCATYAPHDIALCQSLVCPQTPSMQNLSRVLNTLVREALTARGLVVEPEESNTPYASRNGAPSKSKRSRGRVTQVAG